MQNNQIVNFTFVTFKMWAYIFLKHGVDMKWLE